MSGVTVDPVNLQKLGGKLRSSAEKLGNQATEIEKVDFGAVQAGREYGPQGQKVHDALVHLSAWLKNWRTAVDVTGAQFVACADAYTKTDDATVHRIAAAVDF
ncbi:hypothetical protein [Nocardia sp. NPDC052566]|uniref:hypothetical protein n=1 Tax=Nocardia sp. NPDC052566 TaxID=3364330 RepID=UPI0037C9B11E